MNSLFPLPDNPDDALFNGISFCQIGAYPGAQVFLDHCLVNDPGNIRARYYLGLTQFRLHEYDAAVRTLNQLERMGDPEARLAAQMLQRTYRLEEGNPMFDVKFLGKDVVNALCEYRDESILEPELFARIVWQQPCGLSKLPDTALDLSIVLGPNHHWLCVIPPSQGLHSRDCPLPVLPTWTCSAKVFDRVGAAMMFFQRALYDWRETFARFFTPQIVQTTFPEVHQEILLRRIFPEPFVFPLGLLEGLFPITTADMRRMFINNPAEVLRKKEESL